MVAGGKRLNPSNVTAKFYHVMRRPITVAAVSLLIMGSSLPSNSSSSHEASLQCNAAVNYGE